MSIDLSTSTNLPRLGELFVEAGVVNSKTVADCLYTAQANRMPVGKALIQAGHVSAPDVESALQTQDLLKAGTLSRQSAVRLVRRMHCSKITIEEAQAQEFCDRAFSMPFSLVGKLLLASGIISEQALLTATRKTTQQLPLGTLLVSEKALSKGLLIDVMNCLILIRDKKISKYQATQILRHLSKTQNVDFPAVLTHYNLEHLIGNNTPRLLDLLTASNLLAKNDADWCLEISVETGRQTGQVLLLYGLVDETLLDSALSLQQMLAVGTLQINRASELLTLCREAETTLESLLAELNQLNLVVKFLRQANVLDEQVIAVMAHNTSDFESNCGSILVREGVVSHEMLLAAMQHLSDLQNDEITEKQALNSIRSQFKSYGSNSEPKTLAYSEIDSIHTKLLDMTA